VNLPSQPKLVASPLVLSAHNTLLTVVSHYGELLSEQERRLQAFAAQLAAAQQQCAQLTEACRGKDERIRALQDAVVSQNDSEDAGRVASHERGRSEGPQRGEPLSE